jgi:hypothetical protein
VKLTLLCPRRRSLTTASYSTASSHLQRMPDRRTAPRPNCCSTPATPTSSGLVLERLNCAFPPGRRSNSWRRQRSAGGPTMPSDGDLLTISAQLLTATSEKASRLTNSRLPSPPGGAVIDRPMPQLPAQLPICALTRPFTKSHTFRHRVPGRSQRSGISASTWTFCPGRSGLGGGGSGPLLPALLPNSDA